ncbi:MAG: acyl carrier protein [Bacilli bacterium]|nr:acyl carrier protein [Bacilli bacterium]
MAKNKEENNRLEEIIDIMVETLEVDRGLLNENTRFADLDVDSLDLVNLVVAFEKRYNFEIPDNEIKNLQTIKDVVDYVESHV